MKKQSVADRLIDSKIKPEELVKVSDELTEEKDKVRFFRFYDKVRKKVSKKTPDLEKIETLNIKDLLFFLPDFMILFSRVLTDKRVSRKQKFVLACILGYIVMPLDLIPDFIPGLGFMDDLIIAIYGVHYLLSEIDREIIKELWPGKENLLDKINLLIYRINTTIYSPLLSKIKYILVKFGIDV